MNTENLGNSEQINDDVAARVTPEPDDALRLSVAVDGIMNNLVLIDEELIKYAKIILRQRVTSTIIGNIKQTGRDLDHAAAHVGKLAGAWIHQTLEGADGTRGLRLTAQQQRGIGRRVAEYFPTLTGVALALKKAQIISQTAQKLRDGELQLDADGNLIRQD